MSQTLLEELRGKRFGLVLSAGFFGFYGHAGAVRAIEEAGLKPSAYAGTSAGGLVASYAAAGLSASEIVDLILKQTRADFWDPDPIGALTSSFGHGLTGLLRGERFRKLLERTLPVRRFEDTASPLLVVATALHTGDAVRFSSEELAPRVHATCAYPGLFRAATVDGEQYWDGGLVDKAPALALWESKLTELDALVVHYLPSRLRKTVSGPLAYAQAMDVAMTASRREHFKMQLELLRSRGVQVYVVESQLPSVSPTRMHQGHIALDAGHESMSRALNERAPTT